MKEVIENIEYEYQKLNNSNISLLHNFHCGNSQIDEDIKHNLIDDSQKTTHLIINGNNDDVICVYSLSCSGYVVVSKGKTYVYPAVEIQYFAVNKTYQDVQYSNDPEDGCIASMILYSIIGDIYNFTDTFCGADKIILYSTPDAVEFYTKCGFESFREFMLRSNDRYLDGCEPMFLDL